MIEQLTKQFREWLMTLPPAAQERERPIGEANIARIANFLGVK